jgi:hypothetical protein
MRLVRLIVLVDLRSASASAHLHHGLGGLRRAILAQTILVLRIQSAQHGQRSAHWTAYVESGRENAWTSPAYPGELTPSQPGRLSLTFFEGDDP